MTHTLLHKGIAMIGNPDLSGEIRFVFEPNTTITVPGDILRMWFEKYLVPEEDERTDSEIVAEHADLRAQMESCVRQYNAIEEENEDLLARIEHIDNEKKKALADIDADDGTKERGILLEID